MSEYDSLSSECYLWKSTCVHSGDTFGTNWLLYVLLLHTQPYSMSMSVIIDIDRSEVVVHVVVVLPCRN